MARLLLEVPFDDIAFPPSCARCGATAADKPVVVRRAKPSRARWFLFFGLIGSAIATSRPGSQVQFNVPYCLNCQRRARSLKLAAWGMGIMGLLLTCSFPMIAAGLAERSEALANTVGYLGLCPGLLLVLIGLPAVLVLRSRHNAVQIKQINERIGSARLGFGNPRYFDEFRALNLRRLVAFALHHGLPLPVEVDRAIAAVGEGINEEEPRSPSNLAGYFERGQLYLMAGSYPRAVEDLNRVIEVTGFENPYFVDAHFFRGRANMQLSRYQQAVTDFESFIKASDDRRKVREAKRLLKEVPSQV